jgi:hypothetical protein
MDWEKPCSREYLGHQALEKIYFDPLKSKIEWTHPLAFGAKVLSLDTPSLREIQSM